MNPPESCAEIDRGVGFLLLPWPGGSPDSAHGSPAAVGPQGKKWCAPERAPESSEGFSRPLRGAAGFASDPTATLRRCRGLILVATPGHAKHH